MDPHWHRPKSPTRCREEQFPGSRLRGAVRLGLRVWVQRQPPRAVSWAQHCLTQLVRAPTQYLPPPAGEVGRGPPPAGEPDPGSGGPELPPPPPGVVGRPPRAAEPCDAKAAEARCAAELEGLLPPDDPGAVRERCWFSCSCRCWFCWRRSEAALPMTEPIREPGMPARRLKADPATAPIARPAITGRLP